MPSAMASATAPAMICLRWGSTRSTKASPCTATGVAILVRWAEVLAAAPTGGPRFSGSCGWDREVRLLLSFLSATSASLGERVVAPGLAPSQFGGLPSTGGRGVAGAAASGGYPRAG